MIRIAAVGDIHLGPDAVGTLAPRLADLHRHADVLLLAGDLTRRGRLDEAEVVAGEVADAPVPVVAVLGNHDLESGQQDGVRALLESAGVTVLDGEAVHLDIDGVRLGVAGAIGFGGGFRGATCADFGEVEFKAFVARTRLTAGRLEDALAQLDADLRVALTHYAPVRDTVVGENPEIFPFLGSHQLADVVDRHPVDLHIHGHAHHGTEKGATPGGVPVRNVALPVLGRPYGVYRLGVGVRSSVVVGAS